ncbi:peptidoglycan-binding domain-containing protein [Methylobacterium nodulans]|uniref:Peptidoglycan-binding domain 1 protein n=1 Tax=Methylobacterium nodulans (strain LMG 21967 / CNCM I-2342 / ORS 2060) TaxID=460265 RepID=B8IF34_METNO|nr:peptidoglycan-binding domain-containing protein [Methylobacterium nodulans]ACL55745.1 Peptidoglycan-binding domain 1 protein [Methylobacterium nodulans ORS 2060]
MPEVPARPPDPDLTLTPEARPLPRPRGGSARRGPAPRPAPPRALARLREGLNAVLRHPVGIVGGVLVLAATAAVAVNALSFQTGRHPAPLFAKFDAKPDAKAGARSDAKPGTAAAPAPRPAKAALKPPDPKPPETSHDGIGELIKGDAQSTASVALRDGTPKPPSASRKSLASLPPPRPRAEAPPAPPIAAQPKPSVKKAEAAREAGARKPDPQVMFAQKALVKLGYGPLAIDGVAGPATRAAITRFERERHLPGRPDVANRTLKELASRSGLRPE